MKAERLVLLVGIAFVAGLLVLLLVPEYRISRNLESNASYFPSPEDPTRVVGISPTATAGAPSSQDVAPPDSRELAEDAQGPPALQ
jgi:hypothetical protein